MRGKRVHTGKITGDERNIPAYAGKTPRRNLWIRFSSEHPRVCGENLHEGAPGGGKGGTSPRMRGKQKRLKPAGQR